MDEKEKLLKEIQGLIDDSTKEGVKKADLDARIEKLNADIAEKLDNAGMKELKESVDNLLKATSDNAASIKALTEKEAKDAEPKPRNAQERFYKAIMEGFDEAIKNVPELATEVQKDGRTTKSIKEYFTRLGNKHTPEIRIKAAVDMLESNIEQSEVALVANTQLLPGIIGIPLTIYPNVTEWMPKKKFSGKQMSILVAYSYTDGAGTKTEGSAGSKSSFLLKTVEFPAFVIDTYGVLSEETLDDLPQVMEEISRVFPSKILDELNSQILSTSGDDSTAIAGLFTANKMTAFAATWDGTIKDATVVDLVEKMKLQCLGNKYRPNVVGLNPTDISNLGSLKDQLDNSLTDRRVSYNAIGEATHICGLRVIKSTDITADTCFVAEAEKLILGDRRDMRMEIGYNSTDFTEGQKTVRISIRVAFGVEDKAAVIYSSGIAADVSAITEV